MIINAMCNFHALTREAKSNGRCLRLTLIQAATVCLRILRRMRLHKCHKSRAQVRLMPNRFASWPLTVSINQCGPRTRRDHAGCALWDRTPLAIPCFGLTDGICNRCSPGGTRSDRCIPMECPDSARNNTSSESRPSASLDSTRILRASGLHGLPVASLRHPLGFRLDPATLAFFIS
jgi:hypothetical protein